MTMIHLLFSWVEHEKCFITLEHVFGVCDIVRLWFLDCAPLNSNQFAKLQRRARLLNVFIVQLLCVPETCWLAKPNGGSRYATRKLVCEATINQPGPEVIQIMLNLL